MTTYRYNAAVYEQNRLDCEEAAERAKAAGDLDRASGLFRQAAEWQALRDADVRQQERRLINRRAHRRYR